MRVKRVLPFFLSLFLVACGSAPSAPPAPTPPPATPEAPPPVAEAFPRTLTVEGHEVTIEAKPSRIAAVSGDVADFALALAGPERVVVVTSSQANPVMYGKGEQGGRVANQIRGATNLDPEAILAYEPDLLLLTERHGAETSATELLGQSGLPIMSFTDWSTVEKLLENLQLISLALGEDEAGAAMIADWQDRLATVASTIEGVEPPSVLVLAAISSNDTKPYFMGPGHISYDVVHLAGGVSAADGLGLEKTTVASLEQVIAADPEYIVLIEWLDEDGERYSEFMDNPGLQAVRAVQEGKVRRFPARWIQTANTDLVTGIEELARWLHPEAFSAD